MTTSDTSLLVAVVQSSIFAIVNSDNCHNDTANTLRESFPTCIPVGVNIDERILVRGRVLVEIACGSIIAGMHAYY
jgi:hypothetical protein